MTYRPLSVIAASDRQGRLFGRKVLSERLMTRPLPVFSASAVPLYWNEQRELTVADQVALERGPDILLVPDLGAVWPYPTRPRTNLCLVDLKDSSGAPLAISPRQMLKRQLSRLATFGIHLRTATELEFYLSPVLDHSGGYLSVQPSGRLEAFLDMLYLEMEHAGIPLHALQAELGDGQWEISFEPAGPLLTADRHVIFKHVAAQLAHDHGLRLSFAACADEGKPASSCHVHCSIYGLYGNLLNAAEECPSSQGAAALNGWCTYLPDLLLLAAPNENSYRRHALTSYSGRGGYLGRDDRRASLRLLGHGEQARCEHRYAGADANPYLVLSGIIAAMLAGFEAGHSATKSQEARSCPLPSNLVDAARRFAASAVVERAFGAEVQAAYAAPHLDTLPSP